MNGESDSERGTALVLVLLLLAIFTLLGAAYLQVSSTESSISRNEVNGALAFNLADAGLEHAIPLLPGTDVDALLSSGTAMLANQSLGEGAYEVTITNNMAPTYPLRAIPADTGGATADDDGYIVLTSTGQFKDAVRSVSVLAKKTTGGGTSSPFAQGVTENSRSRPVAVRSPASARPLAAYERMTRSIPDRRWSSATRRRAARSRTNLRFREP